MKSLALKNARKYFSMFLAIVMILVISMPTYVSANETSSETSMVRDYRVISDDVYYPDDYIGYNYPVRPGTLEWASLSDHQAMVEACMIPEDVLVKMSTEELVQTILAYPLIADLFAYDDWNFGLEIVTANFNGLETLRNRDDSVTHIVSQYAEMDPIYISRLDDATIEAFSSSNTASALDADYEVCRDILYSMVLGALLSNETYSKKLTQTDAAILIDVASQHELALNNTDVYTPVAESLVYENIAAEAASYTYLYQLGYSWYHSGSTPISGPNNKTVTAYTNVCYETWMCSDNVVRLYPLRLYADLPTAYKTTLNNQMYNVYGINPVAPPTVKYNCHSYAWYLQSSSNPYWINDITPYINSGAYSVVGQMNTSVGDRVVYYLSSNGTYTNPSHTAVITSYTNISSSQRSFTLKSKWGMCGLYSHSLTNCPYYYGESNNMGCLYDYRFYG